MTVSVIGCGRWGTFIAWYLTRAGHQTTLFGRPGSERFDRLCRDRGNELLTLPAQTTLTNDLAQALCAQVLVVSVPSQSLRGLCAQIAQVQPGLAGKTIVLCMKGLEMKTGERLSEIAGSFFEPENEIAVWLGPGHVQDFCRDIPNCMVIDSRAEPVKKRLVAAFSSDLIRFYYGADLLGNEMGAAAKNVVGIAAGILDGLGLSSLKGALMSRSTREIARLIEAMGGSGLSAYGLCHLGDYEATVFSPHSHNRAFGEAFAQSKSYSHLAEGYYTVLALVELGRKYEVELPICSAVYQALYEQKDPRAAIDALFMRSVKHEF